MVQAHIISLGEAKCTRTEQEKISRRAFSKFRKDTYDFPEEKNIIRTDLIFHILSKSSSIRL